ncbi:MAG: hypothetical protein KDD82_06595, partial [Planctomycetes bacterium]|nr:hypothetical protein [Planctomycetota bacterium]
MPATRPQQARLPRLRCRAEVLVPGARADLLNPGAYPGEVAALATPERTLIALGVAWRASWDAPPAAGALAELCSAWLERLPEPGDEALAQLPWIWGGRGFFARPLTGPWRGWPSAELRVPRHVLAAEAGSERVTLLSFVDEAAPRPRALPRRSQHAAQTEALPSRDAWIAHAERARQAVIDGGAEPGGLAKLVPVRATRFCLPSGARYDAGCLWEALG